MSFFKRALISIWQRKGRTALFLGLFLIVFLLILSGFAIKQSAEKSKIDARKQLGAEVRLKRDNDKIREAVLSGKSTIKPLSKETIDQISHLPQVKSVLISGETGAAKGDLQSVAPRASNEENSINSNMANMSQGQEVPVFKIHGTNDLLKTADFKSHDAKLIEGEPITEKSLSNSAVVEQTFAKNNQLKLGDTFKIQGFSIQGEEKAQEYKVSGIYKSEKEVSTLEQMYEMAQPENQIYVDIDSFLKTSKQANIDDAMFYLKDPLQVGDFVKDAEAKLPSESNFFKLDAYTEQYEQMIGPLEKMAAFSSIMIKVIVIAGGLILTFLSLLSIRDRKKEVGILLSLGETKMKVILQLVAEILIIGLLSFGLSLVIVQATGQTITNSMLSKQAEQVGPIVQQDDDYGQEKNKNLEPIDKMELRVNATVVSQAGSLGFLLIIITTLVPSVMIARTDPKELFVQKE
ncbi:hypothetical protein A5821_003413 [Enterococcus sp. 7F3_DIV0205]|uniref:ABC3 transporter permease protein domain-containing protein n=1 Tax=Candidatus Enterococcus palustris TaxID=1834189 RepID=A0AAQ3Y6J8_9ENTE|nr:ABC transporter permease [Enterococcus sp. 7F3_DIV0205]OTN84295.1 hypothetical protein A5821_000221 [Enterococcus sp. 7F3_DIV0205]